MIFIVATLTKDNDQEDEEVAAEDSVPVQELSVVPDDSMPSEDIVRFSRVRDFRNVSVVSDLTEKVAVASLCLETDPQRCECFITTKAAPIDKEGMFFQLENLPLAVEPKCGGCKCSKCLVPGSQYSFKEQKEYDGRNGHD